MSSNRTQNLELLTQTEDVAATIKHALIEQDMQMWRNTRFQAESRRRVYARIGNAEAEAEQIKMLQSCEAAIMELEEQLREVPKDA